MATVHSVSIKAELDAKNAQATAEKLHKTIKQTKDEAAALKVPSGTTTAPKSAPAPSGGSSTLNAAKKASAPSSSFQEARDYDNSRAMRPGGTGASARDFAQQAQGLGGLVRLYATYAANIFAVAAAFNALQAAQDTANMVKGLNQLGAASGAALGSLSKQLVKATDEAVSLREAMEATVKASSSGMSSKDILRMGEVAKKASQALGVNMADALSRLSRGITKLEPELLDELGIFTRIDPAVQAYAKSVNKSVSDLSQFERQMAFSNAVLEEGERKFNAINIETNAYTQLLAKLKDAATTIGDALNVVLVPIVKLLQSSPTALYTLIGSMALLVTKQAIPAFSNMRKAMLDNLTAMGELAEKKRDGLTKVMTDIATQARKQAEKAMEIPDDKFLAEQARIKKLTDSIGLRGKLTQGFQALSPGITDIAETEKLIKRLEQQVKTETTKNSGKADVYTQMLTAAKAHYDQELKYQDKLKDADANALKRMQKTVEYKAIVRELQDVQNAQAKAFIVNAAQETTRVEGLVAGHRKLTEEIKKRRDAAIEADKAVKQGNLTQVGNTGFGKAASAAAYGTGLLSIAGAKLENTMGAISPWLAGFALAQAALGVLDAWLDNTAEQAGKFNDAINQSTDATNTLSENISRLNSLKISEFFNPETIKGTQTAIIGITDSISTLAQKFEALKEKQKDSQWARMKDGFASIWGGDTQTKFTEGVAKQVASLLKDLDRAPAKFKATSEAITKLTGVSDPTNLNAMEKALKGIDPKSEKFKDLSRILQQLKVDAGNLATDVTAFKTSLTEFGDATQALSNQFIDKDPLTVFALKGLAASDKLQKALKGELVGAVSAIGEALEDLGKKPLFGQDADIAQLGKMKVALESMQKTLVDNEREIKDLTEQRAKVQKEINIDSFGNTYLDDAKIESLSKQIKLKQQQLATARSKAPQLVAEIQELSTKGANSFLDILDAKIAVTMAKGGSAFMNAVASALGNLPGVATMKANAQLADIGFQQNLIKLQMQMLEQQTLQRINSDILVQEAEVQRIQIRDPNNATQAAAMAAQKLDKMKSEKAKIAGTKDPRELLALSKDKSGETASALRDFALAKAGMYSQLKALGDQAAGINFTKKVEELGAEIDARKKVLDIVKQSNTETLSNIDLQEKLNGGISDEDILRRSTLVQENIRSDTTKEILDNLSRQAVLDLAISSNVISAKAKQSALDEKANLNKQLQNTYAKQARELAQEEYAARLKILDNAKKEEAFQVNKLDLAEQTKKTIESTKLNTYESDIGIQKDYGVDTGAQDLQLQAMKDAESFRAQAAATELAQRKEIFDILTKLGSIQNQDSTEYTNLIAILNLTKEKYATITAGEEQAKIAAEARLTAQEKILDITREQEIRTQNLADLAGSIVSIFDRTGEQVQLFAQGLAGVLNTMGAIAKKEEDNLAQKTKLKEIIEETEGKHQVDAKGKALKDLSNLEKKQANDKLKGEADLLNSTKKMFKEKTAAYKILDAMEKVKHLQIMWNMAMELKSTLVNLGTAISASIAGSTAMGVAKIPTVMMAFMEWLGPFGMAAGAAAVASVLGGSGGGFTAQAAQLQETQGTGQSYDASGNLIANGGGVLGDQTAKNQDIGNSIDRLNNLTIDGNVIGLDMVIALEKIKYNTQQMAAGFFKVQGLTGGLSGFGTIEKSSPGLLGLFASSTQIIDTGIKFLSGQFKQYETVQKTNSGFLGIGKSTKTFDNTMALPSSLEDDINQLFADNVKISAKALGDLTGLDAKKLETQLTNAISKEGFKVSLKDLKGEEVGDALMSVISETIGVPLREMAPFLDKFRQIGEGTVGTLIRLNAETTYVDKAFQAMGNNTLNLLPKVATQATQQQIDAASQAQAKVNELTEKLTQLKDAAQTITNSGWDNNRGSQAETTALDAVTTAEKELEDAKIASANAQKALVLAETTNIQSNIALTQKLIQNAGGIDKFTEQMGFFQSKFVSAGATQAFNFSQLNIEMKKLGYSAQISRAEFTSIVQGLDLNTTAGQNLYQSLMNLAPAMDQVATDQEKTGQFLTDKFLEAVEAGYSPEQTGKYVADQLLYSIQRTMYDSTVGEIMNTFSAGIITPILNAAKSGANASTLIAMLAEGEVQSTLAKVRVMAQNLATVMNSQAWKDLQQTFSGVVQDFVSTVQTQLPTLDLVAPSIADAGSASSSATTEVDKLTESLKELAKSSVTSLFDTLTSTLKKNADTIKSSITKLKDFIKSITEFKTSLLLGDKSTLTSSEKYLKAKTDFETTYAKAQTGDETAIGKLQTVSEGFLEASRDFYASGSQYTSDFNSVMSAIDSSISQAEQLQQKLETNLRDVYDQLVILDSIDSNITDIKAVLEIGLAKTANQILAFMDRQGDTGYTAQALLSSGLAQTLKQAQQLIAAYDLNKDNIASKDEIRHAGNIGSTTGSVTTAVSNPSSLTVENASKDMLNTYGAYTVGNIGSGYAIADPLGAVATSTDKANWSIMLRNGVTAQRAELKAALEQEMPKLIQQGKQLELRNALVQFGLSQYQLSAIMGWQHQDVLDWVAANNLPAFAQGTNYVPYDMPAMIHEGERIFPKADNEELMKSVKGNNNAELITEIRRLNDKVASLERTVAQGAAVNAQATDRNTEAVVGAVSDSTNRTIQSNNIRERATLR